MWFKCGADLLQSAIMRDLSKCAYRKEAHGNNRMFKFILLLSETAEDRADDLQDADDLARLVDTTPKQARIVWDVLIKHNVLRQGPNGYSAKAWMLERGILGDTRKRQNGDGHGRNEESRNSFL